MAKSPAGAGRAESRSKNQVCCNKVPVFKVQTPLPRLRLLAND